MAENEKAPLGLTPAEYVVKVVKKKNNNNKTNKIKNNQSKKKRKGCGTPEEPLRYGAELHDRGT